MEGNVVLVLCAATLVVFACLMCRCVRLGAMATLRREGNHWLRVDLRRRIEMRTHADGLGGFSYPEPAETRILSWRLCGLPVWSRTESIGLPADCEGHTDEVRPEDFDQHFTVTFKLEPQQSRSTQRASRTAVA